MWLTLEGVKGGLGPLSGSEPLHLPCCFMKTVGCICSSFNMGRTNWVSPKRVHHKENKNSEIKVL